jgi:hypothetical protein
MRVKDSALDQAEVSFMRWNHEVAATGSGTENLLFAASACREGSTTVPIIPIESPAKVEIW